MANALQEKIETEVRKENGLPEIINRFSHIFNPLHLVYCNLSKNGFSRKKSLKIARLYEIPYNFLMRTAELAYQK